MTAAPSQTRPIPRNDPMTIRALSQLRPVPRRGLSRIEAAIYVGIGTTKFDEMVADGRMPKPFRIDERVIWDICDLDPAIDRLKEPIARNPWDRVA
jgi:predicted DNA-binding transcriptional regulator AlpA